MSICLTDNTLNAFISMYPPITTGLLRIICIQIMCIYMAQYADYRNSSQIINNICLIVSSYYSWYWQKWTADSQVSALEKWQIK